MLLLSVRVFEHLFTLSNFPRFNLSGEDGLESTHTGRGGKSRASDTNSIQCGLMHCVQARMRSVDDDVAMLTKRDSGQPGRDPSFGTKAPGAHGITQSLPNPSIVIREPTVQTFDDSNSACAVRTGAYTRIELIPRGASIPVARVRQ